MKTIIEKISEMELKNKEARLAEMIKVAGPKILVDTLEKQISEIKVNGFKVNDKEKLGKEEYIKHEVLKGRGGAIYVQFNGNINYFPQGKYEAFLSMNKK